MRYYGIAVRLNNAEYIVLGLKPYGPIVLTELEAVKEVFKPFYDLLKLQPDSNTYLNGIGQLLTIRPAVYSIESTDPITEINNWRDGDISYKAEMTIVSVPHLVAPMKKGFLEKYMVLDIVKDIEESISVEKDGAMFLREFKTHYSTDNKTPMPVEFLTAEKALEVLKKRGLR